jgi:predicted glycosyltransferase
MALAAGLAERFRVVFLNGGPLPQGVSLPAGMEVIDLPPLGLDADGQLVSRVRTNTLEDAQELRRKMILDTFHSLRPQIVLIELFPFGRKKFADELLPMLEEAITASPRPLVVCSLRDILVGQRRDQQRHDERAAALANHYFDAILVHSDPAFARLEESFHAFSKLTIPIHYTGYVCIKRVRKSDVIRQRRVIVSAGGGLVGCQLFQIAIEAHALLRDENVEMKVIAGPFLPEESWQSLLAATQGLKGVQLLRSVPDLCEEMRGAAASVSQCGYNTSLDILQSGVPALVVPYATGLEDEQMQRASRLEQLGAVRLLDQREMTSRRLADELRALLCFKPQGTTLDLNGVRNSAGILEEIIQLRASRAAHSLEAVVAGREAYS